MVEQEFITIKDYSPSNAIWNGSELYMFSIKPVAIASDQAVSAKIKNFQNIDVSEDGNDYSVNFDRRKAYVNYGGFNNAIVSLSCVYNPVTIGTSFTHDGGSRVTFTPSKLYELILNPRTVYLQDEFIIRDLLSATEGSSPAVYSGSGMPVVLQSWSITPTVDGKEVIMDLSFIEDKEIS